jgi:hypothetical protein
MNRRVILSAADLMRRLRASAGCVLLLAALCGSEARGQERDAPRGAVSGRVMDAVTERPVAGADVALEGTALRTTADASGVYRLQNVPPGVYRLVVRAIGYTPYVQSDVVVGSGKPYTVNVMLNPQAVRLEAVEVRPSYFRAPERAGANTRVLGREETRRAPGVQEDVVRAVALLPGVSITSAGRNDLFVRGGAPYENLFVVDGIQVPNVNHFGSQGSTGGPLSLINIEFLQEATFSAGGYGAKYGDRTASFTNIRLREGNGDRLSGELNLSATGFGLILEGPLPGNGSFLGSLRRSYLDLIFRAADFSFVPRYWDFSFKTAHRIGRSNTLSFLAIGALDRVDFFNETADDRFDNSRILAPEQNQYFTGLTWKHFLSSGTLTVTLGRTFTKFNSEQRDSLGQSIFRSLSSEGENALQADLALEPGRRTTLTFGAVAHYASDLTYDVLLDGFYRLDADGIPSTLAVDTTFNAFRIAGYGEVGYGVSSRLTATLGARVTHYAFVGETRLDPRIGARYALGRNTALIGSAGRYHQPPSYIWLIGDPANPGTLDPIRSDQVVLGVERQLRPDTKLQIEAFYKWYGSYAARGFRPQAVLAPSGFEDVTNDIPFGLEPLASVGTGRSYGVEVFVQKKLSAVPLYGLVSLTFTHSEFESLDSETRPGAYDGHVIANILAGYRFNDAWEVSGKFRLATGLPSTPFVTEGIYTGRLDFSQYNAGPRLPLFNSLDVRVDRRWSFRSWQLELYVDIQNIYGRKNVSGYRWNPRDQAPEADESLGILPTIGVNLQF